MALSAVEDRGPITFTPTTLANACRFGAEHKSQAICFSGDACGPNASSSNQSKRIRLYPWSTDLRPSSLGSSHSNGTASGSGSFCDAADADDWWCEGAAVSTADRE